MKESQKCSAHQFASPLPILPEASWGSIMGEVMGGYDVFYDTDVDIVDESIINPEPLSEMELWATKQLFSQDFTPTSTSESEIEQICYGMVGQIKI